LIRGWVPVVLIPITYKELSYLIPLIHPRDFDSTLAAIDYRFLVCIQPYGLSGSPGRNHRSLQLTYSSYYFCRLSSA